MSVIVSDANAQRVPVDEDALIGAKLDLASELATAGAGTQGIAFILQATDPWHTDDTARVGAPLFDSGKSVILEINRSTVVTAPAGILAAGVGIYDAHFAAMPVLGNASIGGLEDNPTVRATSFMGLASASGIFPGNVTSYALGPAGPYAGTPIPGTEDGWPMDALVAVHTVPINQATYTPGFALQGSVNSAYTQPAGTPGSTDYHGISVPELIDPTQARLVGLSYKITNTTPPLDQGGMVMDYAGDRLPEKVAMHKLDGGETFSEVAIATNVPCLQVFSPPFAIEKVQLLKHCSRPASLGSLVTVPIDLTSTGQTATFPVPLPTVYVGQMGLDPNDDVTYDGAAGPGVLDILTSEAQYVDNNLSPGVGSFSRMLGIRSAGSYFTGLPWNTTLFLEVRALVEVFPQSSDPLIQLATPSPPSDPIAVQLYDKIARSLPAGAPGGSFDNDFGDWLGEVFSTARNAVEDVVEPLAKTLSALPGPIGAAARTTDAILEPALAVSEMIAPRRRRKRKQKGGRNGDQSQRGGRTSKQEVRRLENRRRADKNLERDLRKRGGGGANRSRRR